MDALTMNCGICGKGIRDHSQAQTTTCLTEANRLSRVAADQHDRDMQEKACHEAECVEIGQFIKAGGQIRRGIWDETLFVAISVTGRDGCASDPVAALRMAIQHDADVETQRRMDAKAAVVQGDGAEDPF